MTALSCRSLKQDHLVHQLKMILVFTELLLNFHHSNTKNFPQDILRINKTFSILEDNFDVFDNYFDFSHKNS